MKLQLPVAGAGVDHRSEGTGYSKGTWETNSP